MKSDIDYLTEPKKIVYPVLMEMREGGEGHTVVLFHRDSAGTVVYTKGISTHELGETDSCWCMGRFTPFVGSVTLEND